MPTLTQIYPIEVIASYPAPLGQKAHETVVTCEVRPSEVHEALVRFGLVPGRPVKGDEQGCPSGSEVRLAFEFTDGLGITRQVPVEEVLFDSRTGQPLPRLKWRFTGSVLRRPDPQRPDTAYGADLGGTLITLFPVTDETVIQSELTLRDRKLVRPETNKDLLPPEGSPVKLIISVVAPEKGIKPMVPDTAPISHFLPPSFGMKEPQEVAGKVLIPPRTTYLPPPVRVRSEARKLLPNLPVINLPSVDEPLPEYATGATPPPPVPSFAVGKPRSQAACDISRPPLPAALVDRWESAPSVSTETAKSGYLTRTVLGGTAPLRTSRLPFARLDIPDPFRIETEVQPDQVPAEAGFLTLPPLPGPMLPTLPTNFPSATGSAAQ